MHTYNKGGAREVYFPADPAKPLISVIIATLNAGNHLENCIRSIISQEYQNIELLIFDGGSTDSTIDIIKTYEKQISYWQSETDNGIYNALNKAIKHSKGEWLYFLGADDKLLAGFAQMAGKLEDSNTIYYGDMSYDGKPTSRKKYSRYRLSKETICHQAIIYPRSVFDFYSYETDYPLAADWVLNLRLWADKRYSFQFYPYLIADFSMQGLSSTRQDHHFRQNQSRLIRQTLGMAVYLRHEIKKLRKKLFKK